MPEMARDSRPLDPKTRLSRVRVRSKVQPRRALAREATHDQRFPPALASGPCHPADLVFCRPARVDRASRRREPGEGERGRISGDRRSARRLGRAGDDTGRQTWRPRVASRAPTSHALRQQLEAAQTQIALLKNVVIQALRAQSAAEEALRREQATPQTAPAPGRPGPAGAPEPALAEQLEALTDTVERPRKQRWMRCVAGRRTSRSRKDAGAAMHESRSDDLAEEALAAAAEEEDAMLPELGHGRQVRALERGRTARV